MCIDGAPLLRPYAETRKSSIMSCSSVTYAAASPPTWSIPDEEAGLSTESVSVQQTCEMTELKNGCGETTNVAFFNRQNRVTITGRGIAGGSYDSVGVSLTLANAAIFTGTHIVGTLFLTSIQHALNQGQFAQCTLEAMAWDAISGS